VTPSLKNCKKKVVQIQHLGREDNMKAFREAVESTVTDTLVEQGNMIVDTVDAFTYMPPRINGFRVVNKSYTDEVVYVRRTAEVYNSVKLTVYLDDTVKRGFKTAIAKELKNMATRRGLTAKCIDIFTPKLMFLEKEGSAVTVFARFYKGLTF